MIKPKKYSTYLKYLTLPILYLFATNVFAGVFDPPPSDKSIEFLGRIFGGSVGNIYLGGSSNPVISAMFEKLNIIIVAVGTIIVSYIGIVSTINTAQEGQTMGRKWSSIWLPMRSMLGMLLMVPAPGTGYSMIQVAILWAILQGIGAADQVWNMVLDYLNTGISASGSVTIDEGEKTNLKNSGKTLAENLLNSAICAESINNIIKGTATNEQNPASTIAATDFLAKTTTGVNFYQTPPEADINNVVYKTNINIGFKNVSAASNNDVGEIYKKICGQYDVTTQINSDDLNALNLSGAALAEAANNKAISIMEQKILALNTMYNILQPVAQMLVAKKTPLYGYINQAADAYVNIIQNIVRPQRSNNIVNDTVNKGKSAGWVVAGSFYFVLNHSKDQELITTAKTSPNPTNYDKNQSSVPSFEKLAAIKEYITSQPEIDYIDDKLKNGSIYIEEDHGQNSTISGNLELANIGSNGAKLLFPLYTLTSKAMQLLAKVMTNNNDDPLLSIATFGSYLMSGAEIAWLTIIGISVLLSVGAACAAQSPGFMMVFSLVFPIMSVCIAALGLLWLCGATLAIYVPMVPYMIYTVAALGWFLLVIEAIIAAPIVSLGFVIPSGEELGRVVPGLMLLVGILLRPVLMIFGFVLAARLFKAVIVLVNFGMADSLKSAHTASSLLAPIAAMCLYGGFIVALVNKCFALIYIVPDKVLRWIGGPTETTDTSAVQETKQSFDKGASAAKDIGQGAASGYGEKANETLQQKQKEAAQTDPSGLDGNVNSGAGDGGPAATGGANPTGGGDAKPPSGGGPAAAGGVPPEALL